MSTTAVTTEVVLTHVTKTDAGKHKYSTPKGTSPLVLAYLTEDQYKERGNPKTITTQV